jgi:hypothetical protein
MSGKKKGMNCGDLFFDLIFIHDFGFIRVIIFVDAPVCPVWG